ncbi:MAG: hypothetical protein ABIJ11_04700 [Elusimicrobiota bacterium]
MKKIGSVLGILVLSCLLFSNLTFAHFPDPAEHVLHEEKFIAFSSEFAEFNYAGYQGSYSRNAFVIKLPLIDRLSLRAEVPFIILRRGGKSFAGLGDIIPGITAEVFHTEKIHLNISGFFETPTGLHKDGIGAGHLSFISAFDIGYEINETHLFHGGVDVVTGLSEHDEEDAAPSLVHPHSEPEILLHLGNNIKLSESLSFGGGFVDEFNQKEQKHYMSCLGSLLIGRKNPISVTLRLPLRENNRLNWSINLRLTI